MATLAELVQDLPAELYNIILEYTLTTDDEKVTIDEDYEPPKQLHISRATRAAVIEANYSKTRFLWPNDTPWPYLQSWLDSLAPCALETVGTLRFEIGFVTGPISHNLPGAFYARMRKWLVEDCSEDVPAGLSGRLEQVIKSQVERKDRIEWLSLDEMRREVGAPDFDKT